MQTYRVPKPPLWADIWAAKSSVEAALHEPVHMRSEGTLSLLDGGEVQAQVIRDVNESDAVVTNLEVTPLEQDIRDLRIERDALKRQLADRAPEENRLKKQLADRAAAEKGRAIEVLSS